MNEPNLPLDKLLAAAARSLGTKPNDLKNAAETGQLDQVLQHVAPTEAEKLRTVLSDPAAAQKMLRTPHAQALLQQLMKGEKPHG